MGTGQYSFGKPSKITASTYNGRRGVINIEREIKGSQCQTKYMAKLSRRIQRNLCFLIR